MFPIRSKTVSVIPYIVVSNERAKPSNCSVLLASDDSKQLYQLRVLSDYLSEQLSPCCRGGSVTDYKEPSVKRDVLFYRSVYRRII